MIESIEYGLFLITDHGEVLASTSEDPNEIKRREGELPAVQPTVIRTRKISRGGWSK